MRFIISIYIVYIVSVFTINKLRRKEKEDMAVIYATLIVKGTRTIESVPMVIREQVRQILIDLELPELAGENV